MEEHISIKMDDGQLTYIEVNGIQYRTLDEIPDPQDRAQVKALLLDSNGEDFDTSLDASFQEEFRKMQQQSRIFPTAIAVIFGMVAVILLVVSVASTFQALHRLRIEQAANGQVVKMVERRILDESQPDHYQAYAYPVVAFSLANGQPEKVKLGEGSWPPAYATGDQVTVLYDPGQPEQARIQSAAGGLFLWLWPAVTGFVGLTFLMVSLMFFRFRKPSDPMKEDQTGVQGQFAYGDEGMQ
jgi:uncharacterized membrane protein